MSKLIICRGIQGSGKSTFSLALFRLVEIERGKIIIDDVETNRIGLKCLRSSLTIVPQDPTMFEGNLRFNLDPMNQYKDSEIINVADESGAKSAVQLAIGVNQCNVCRKDNLAPRRRFS